MKRCMTGGRSGEALNLLAERVGFEPTEWFPVHSISSAASSTTPAPLQIANCRLPIADFERSGYRAIGNWQLAIGNGFWRSGWDSNPRWPLSHSGFRDRCTNPLCDLSASLFGSSTPKKLLHQRAAFRFQNAHADLDLVIQKVCIANAKPAYHRSGALVRRAINQT